MLKSPILIFTLAITMLLAACKQSGGNAPSTLVPDVIPESAPGALVITKPVLLSKISNSNLVIEGTCQSGTTVQLKGDDTQSTTCAYSAFSFTISKTTSNTYFFNLYQENQYGTSATVTVTWKFDNVAPVQLTLTSPLSNP